MRSHLTVPASSAPKDISLRYAANRQLLGRELSLAGKVGDTEYTDALHDLVIRSASRFHCTFLLSISRPSTSYPALLLSIHRKRMTFVSMSHVLAV